MLDVVLLPFIYSDLMRMKPGGRPNKVGYNLIQKCTAGRQHPIQASMWIFYSNCLLKADSIIKSQYPLSHDNLFSKYAFKVIERSEHTALIPSLCNVHFVGKPETYFGINLKSIKLQIN
jgi:hypothetical protein